MSVRSYGSHLYPYCDLICDKCGKKAYAIIGRADWARWFMYEMGWRSHRPGRDYCLFCALDVYGLDGLRELQRRHNEEERRIFSTSNAEREATQWDD